MPIKYLEYKKRKKMNRALEEIIICSGNCSMEKKEKRKKK